MVGPVLLHGEQHVLLFVQPPRADDLPAGLVSPQEGVAVPAEHVDLIRGAHRPGLISFQVKARHLNAVHRDIVGAHGVRDVLVFVDDACRYFALQVIFSGKIQPPRLRIIIHSEYRIEAEPDLFHAGHPAGLFLRVDDAVDEEGVSILTGSFVL